MEMMKELIMKLKLFIYLSFSTGKFLHVLERIETWTLYSLRCYMPGFGRGRRRENKGHFQSASYS